MVNVLIDGEDYKKCVGSSKNMWCSSKAGQYGKGVGNNTKDPTKIERVSKISELAVAKLLKTEEPDYAYREGGDNGFDLEVCGLTVDVKVSLRNYGANVFKAVGRGGKQNIKADLYIFAYLSDESIYDGAAKIEVVGYLSGEEVKALPLCKPRVKFTDEKINKDIKHSQMRPIGELMKELGIDE